MAATVRRTRPDEEELLVAHYRAIWESYGVDEADIRPDAEQCVREFIRTSRQHNEMGAFVALLDNEIVGSAACEVQRLPYPDVTVPSFRKFGYIWSVYVAPSARRQGVAKLLVQEALQHLRALGCTKAVLHSSAAGKGVYRSLGFEDASEMRLDLTPHTVSTVPSNQG